MNFTGDMTEKEIINDFKENYNKVRNLLDEESKNDPDNEPYLSKYKARDILNNMRETLTSLKYNKVKYVDDIVLDAMLGTVLYNIGVVNMETDELTASEKVLTEAVELLSTNSPKPEIVTTLINIYNNLGILWCNRDDSEKAKRYLIEAKELYDKFKCTLQMPKPIEFLINGSEEFSHEILKLFEKAHTLTLYYLAQVYGSLQKNLKSAIYCHVTLRRQLQYSDYEPIEWSLNCATLSQFFAEQYGFVQSRHHLAAASMILDEYEKELRSKASEEEAFLAEMEIFKHRSADVARCWAKYCMLLMSASKTRLFSDDDETITDICTDMSNITLQDEENICGGDIKTLIFPNIDVSKYENEVTAKFLLTFEDAREVFLCCQNWLTKAKEYYTKDTLASDYIELIQDSSQAYSSLAFFEEDDERRCKMHKRRIDMLETLTKEINPTYYMQYCRQIWYELGEIYSDILNIKLEKLNKGNTKPTPHALKKINLLCEKSIENYDHFLNSIKDVNGSIPVMLDEDLIRPVISIYAFIGRNSMKRIAVDKSVQLEHVKKSYESYKAVVDICGKNKDAAAMMREEYSLCQEMIKMLPVKIKKIEAELLS